MRFGTIRTTYYPKKDRAAEGRRWRAKIRKKFIEDMGGKCVKCGFGDWRALQVDHVNGGGSQAVCTPSYYESILEKNGTVYQLLCANCNTIKKYENLELPIKYREDCLAEQRV